LLFLPSSSPVLLFICSLPLPTLGHPLFPIPNTAKNFDGEITALHIPLSVMGGLDKREQGRGKARDKIRIGLELAA